MKKATQILSGCAMATAYTGFLSWLFCISQLEAEFTRLSMAPHLMALFYIAVFLFNSFLSQRNAPLALYVGLQLILGAAAIGLFFLTAAMEPFSKGIMIFISIFLVAGVFGCGYGAEEDFTPKKLIFYFDSMLVLLIILMLLDHLLGLVLARQVMYTCFAAIALSLFCLIAQRAAREKASLQGSGAPLLGRVLLGVLLAVILLLAFGLISFAAAGTQSLSEALFELLKWCGSTLKSLGIAFMNALERFMTWLVSFLPEEKFDTLEGSVETSTIEGSHKSNHISIPRWVWYIIGTLVGLLLIKFFLSMLKERVGEDKAEAHTITQSTRSGTLFSGLKELLSILRAKITFRIACIRGRKTAPGLLLWCEKHVPKSARRQPDESGPAFLRRLSRLDLPDTQKKALLELGQAVEESFYSPVSPPLSPELYSLIRKIKFQHKTTV